MEIVDEDRLIDLEEYVKTVGITRLAKVLGQKYNSLYVLLHRHTMRVDTYHRIMLGLEKLEKTPDLPETEPIIKDTEFLIKVVATIMHKHSKPSMSVDFEKVHGFIVTINGKRVTILNEETGEEHTYNSSNILNLEFVH